jgi:RNA polymerase sigma factor (sigma-70 family)
MRSPAVSSLDAPLDAEAGATDRVDDVLSLQPAPTDEAPDVVLERREDIEAVRRAVADLPSIRALVLRRRYEDDATLSDVGEEIGLSRERARQIQVEAMRSVRRSIEDERSGPVRRRPVSRQMEMAL